MTDHWGHLWLKQYGEIGEDQDTFCTWVRNLSEFSPQTVLSAAGAIIEEGHEYPPNLIKMCRFCRSERVSATRTYFIPPPDVDRTTESWQREYRKWKHAAQKLGYLRPTN